MVQLEAKVFIGYLEVQGLFYLSDAAFFAVLLALSKYALKV